MPTDRRVIFGPEEAERVPVAEKLLALGRKDFEAVYGPTTPSSFNVIDDAVDLSQVGMVNEDTIKMVNEASKNKATLPVPADTPQAPPEAPPAPLMEGALEVPSLTPQAPGAPPKLSEDPMERLKQVAEVLKQMHPNAPSLERMVEWKNMHGDIFMLNVEDRVFIYRYLKRQEWIQINANPQLDQMKEHQVEEMVYDKCMLWPQMDMIQKAGLPAGAMAMVVQQIRMQSLFLDPAYVAQMTFKL